jgi:predicted O-methyltransferase YrrM
MLNTGWRRWDNFLSKFAGKKITVIELGVYLGDSTFWFLDNLLTHPESKIYSVDTFEGSPEYGISFEIVKHKFMTRLNKHKDKKKVNVVQEYSHEALRQLSRIKADVAYIDASHIASDVITDAVLTFPLIKPGGIIIFDDYLWDKIKPKYYTPKPAIDAFISIFEPYIKVLHVERQVFVEKLDSKDYKPAVVELKQKITDICDFMIDMLVRAEQLTLTQNIEKVPKIEQSKRAKAPSKFQMPDCEYVSKEYLAELTSGISVRDVYHLLIVEKGAENMEGKIRYLSEIRGGVVELFNRKNKSKQLILANKSDGKKYDLVYSGTGLDKVISGVLNCRMGGNLIVEMPESDAQLLYLLKYHFRTVRIETDITCAGGCRVEFLVYCFDLLKEGTYLKAHLNKKSIDCGADAEFVKRVSVGLDMSVFISSYIKVINNLCKLNNKELFVEVYKDRIFRLTR